MNRSLYTSHRINSNFSCCRPSQELRKRQPPQFWRRLAQICRRFQTMVTSHHGQGFVRAITKAPVRSSTPKRERAIPTSSRHWWKVGGPRCTQRILISEPNTTVSKHDEAHNAPSLLSATHCSVPFMWSSKRDSPITNLCDRCLTKTSEPEKHSA